MYCPKCKKDIEYLDYAHKQEEYGKATLFDDSCLVFDYQHQEIEDTTYYCPECWDTLFDNDEDAIAFLKGEEND